MMFGYACLTGAFVPDATVEHQEFEDPAKATGRPGSRIPYADLEGVDGNTLQPRYLLGSQFLVFTAASDGPEQAQAASSALGIALNAHRVKSVEPLGANPTDTVLVRPDGIVGWRGADAAGLRQALDDVLCRS